MIYAYTRVSTDLQSTESQLFQINNYCQLRNMKIDKIYSENISGTKEPNERKLGKLLSSVKPGDMIIVSELSRLGRSLYMIMEVLNKTAKKNVSIYACKENFEQGDNIQSKVIAFAFGIAAEIERTLISERTKEALALKKSKGIKLGRPWKDSDHKKSKLSSYKSFIINHLKENKSMSEICKNLNCSRTALTRYIQILKDSNEIR